MNNEKRNEDLIDNKIILRSVYGPVGQKYFINPAKDAKGRYPDCVKRVNSQGDLILTDAERNSGRYFIGEDEVIVVENGTTFDLDDEVDRARWEAIKNAPIISEDRYAKDSKGNYKIDGTVNMRTTNPRYGIAELYVDVPGLETKKSVTKKKLIHNACQYIYDDPRGRDGQLLMARLLGKRMENAPTSDIEDFLTSYAERDPEKIISLYNGDDLNLRLLFVEAKDKNVIYRKNGAYFYSDNTILGATDDAVLSWMKTAKNAKTLQLIRKDTYPDLEPEEEAPKKDNK